MISSMKPQSSLKLPLVLLILSILFQFSSATAVCPTWFESLGTGAAQCVPVRFARMWHTGGSNDWSPGKYINIYSEAMCYTTCVTTAGTGWAFQSFTWTRQYNECYCTGTLATFNPLRTPTNNNPYLWAVSLFAGTCDYYSRCQLKNVPCEDVHICEGRIVLLNGAAPRTIDTK